MGKRYDSDGWPRTLEARFSGVIDRLQAPDQNIFGGGMSWRERGVTARKR